jgi:hypothetical protein
MVGRKLMDMAKLAERLKSRKSRTTGHLGAKPEPEFAAPRQKPRPSIRDVSISPEERVSLYAAARSIPSTLRRKCGLQLPFATYLQDPFVAKQNEAQKFDDEIFVDWEPGLADGPTSARFTVVDYNADTGVLQPPAEWDEEQQSFVSDGKPLDRKSANTLQFHQVSVWAQLQRALAFFEDGNGLGRPIPWAFEGNRLIVVPHGGYGQNAYYDRNSKSLQFYYFENGADTVYTCLSSDIVCHEFGHAVLDGIRPLFNETATVETAAFHEFIGDLTAILLTLRNDTLRGRFAEATSGRIEKADTLSSIAEEFGNAVSGRPYLRSAANNHKLSKMRKKADPHAVSEVLTGAMFDVLKRIADLYQEDPAEIQPGPAVVSGRGSGSKATPRQAFWRAADRMQRMAIQPLDLLPPVEVTFRDYAIAVCRAQRLAEPLDPRGYHGILVDVFRARQILTDADVRELKQSDYVAERFRLSVRHDINSISRSRAAAYRFLNDNREDFLIPANQDFFVSDLYDANKRARQNVPLPRQIVLEYVWREEVPLCGPQFGNFDARLTTMLCGGSLVFNDDGNLLSWAMKPGSLPYGGKRKRGGITSENWNRAVEEGMSRRDVLMSNLVAHIVAGRIGSIIGSEKGLLASRVPPMIAEDEGDFVQFHLSPHLNLSGGAHNRDDDDENHLGERRWEIIS